MGLLLWHLSLFVLALSMGSGEAGTEGVIQTYLQQKAVNSASAMVVFINSSAQCLTQLDPSPAPHGAWSAIHGSVRIEFLSDVLALPHRVSVVVLCHIGRFPLKSSLTRLVASKRSRILFVVAVGFGASYNHFSARQLLNRFGTDLVLVQTGKRGNREIQIRQSLSYDSLWLTTKPAHRLGPFAFEVLRLKNAAPKLFFKAMPPDSYLHVEMESNLNRSFRLQVITNWAAATTKVPFFTTYSIIGPPANLEEISLIKTATRSRLCTAAGFRQGNLACPALHSRPVARSRQ